MKTSTILTVLALALTYFGISSAGEWDVSGFIGFDAQAFWEDSRFSDQDDDLNASPIVQPEVYWQSDDATRRFGLVGFARVDTVDDERSHADIRELHWGYAGDGWDFNLGIDKVFWGVTAPR